MFSAVRHSFPVARSLTLRSHLGAAALRRHGRCSSQIAVGGDAENQATLPAYHYPDISDEEFGIDEPVPPVKIVDQAGGAARASWHHCGCDWCAHPKRLVEPTPQPHLYVVVDDWSEGFSVHKIDLNDTDEVGARLQANCYQRLPHPCFRFEFSNVCAGAQFAALGRKIVASTQGNDGLTIVYDTGTAAQAIVRSPYMFLHHNWNAAVAAGGRLYALAPTNTDYGKKRSNEPVAGGMFCLEETIEHPEFPFGSNENHHARKKWTWRTEPLPVPFELTGRTCSYAVHPDGRTIFFSLDTWARSDKPNGGADTYSYDTDSREWTHHGTWRLPFHDKAHYDKELDAWVSGQFGMIGCCDVIAPSGEEGTTLVAPPSWKQCQEDILSLPESGRHQPVLVSMGGGKFCLVETVTRDGVYRWWGDGDRWVLFVTTFRARYGKNGELEITDRRTERSYVLSRYAGHHFHLHAFWM